MLAPEFVKLCFGLGLLLTAGVTWTSRNQHQSFSGLSSKGADDRYRAFQKTYLVVYLTAMMADWLQGPYVYALYDAYGFSKADNGLLFTAGFGSSAVFGTIVGSLADRLGRRKFAGLYCLLYAISCCTKHVKSFYCLMMGRITGGVATSLLFSVFESWMVSEHGRREFDTELLSGTFSLAVFGNSVVAILAGEVGQVVADLQEFAQVSPTSDVYYGGYCAPFDLAIGCLVLCFLAMSLTWPENYGQKPSGNAKSASQSSDSIIASLAISMRAIMQQPMVLCCGIVCSFFEASMFIFVFQWTPALTEEGSPKPPYGHIFASFMVMSMLGSQIFSLEAKRRSVEAIGRTTLLLAAACHAVPVVTQSTAVRFVSFMLFEVCVGMYFPMIGTLKGLCVPEESRASIYNLYRLPLNIIVVATLVAKVELQTAFAITTVILLVAAFFQSKLVGFRSAAAQYRPVGAADHEFGLDDDPVGLDGQDGEEDELSTIIGGKTYG